MVWGFFSNGYTSLAVYRDIAIADET
jgi:hypothetical protein